MNGFRQQVTLDGGPLDGETRMVDMGCSEVTCWYTVGLRLQEYDTTRLVPLREPASYRRSGPDVFTFCRTQADLGDVWPREFYKPETEEDQMSEVPQETPAEIEEPVEEESETEEEVEEEELEL